MFTSRYARHFLYLIKLCEGKRFQAKPGGTEEGKNIKVGWKERTTSPHASPSLSRSLIQACVVPSLVGTRFLDLNL